MRSVRASLIMVLLGFLPACAATSNDNAAADEYAKPFLWRDAPEDSKFAKRRDEIGDDVAIETAIRCWPIESAFRCLTLTDFAGSRTYRVEEFAVLPESRMDGRAGGNGGYRCERNLESGMLTEAIHSERGLLISQAVAGWTAKRPWSRSFVETYLDENGVAGPSGYLPCQRIDEIISAGSLETVGSTSVTLDLVS